MIKINGGATHFAGKKMGGYNDYVHGMGSKGMSHGENANHKAAFTGEKKVSGCGGELHAKHYAHIK